jgi:predicted DsbA family dithiol-disulfide isomerase
MDAAIAQLKAERPSLPVRVHYRPFMIDPRTDPQGEEYLAYNRRRWGSDGWTRSMRASAACDGCAFADWQWWPNTFHANRLLLLADAQGRGSACKDVLFRLCYEEGANVSDRDVVAAAACEAGVAGGAELVAGDDGAAALQSALREARARRVSSVPFYSVRLQPAGADAPSALRQQQQPPQQQPQQQQPQAYDFAGAQGTDRWRLILEHFAQLAGEADEGEADEDASGGDEE